MFKAITPGFINKIDSYLLANHPILWMSKIHYVLWHGATLWTLSALLGAIMPINLKNTVEYGLWYFLFTVIGIVIFCFWVYRYMIFNKEKKYGSKKFGDEYKNFALVFIAVSIFLMIPWPFEVIFSQRIAHMYTDKEVIADLNTLNENDPYLANSSNNYYSWYDSTSNVQYFNIRKLSPYGSSYYTPYYLRRDSITYPSLITEYQLIKRYKPTAEITILQQKIERFINVAKKYDCDVSKSSSQIAKRYVELLSKEKIPANEFYSSSNGAYQYELQTIFNNVCEAKFSTLFIFKKDFLWGMFYFIFSLSAFLVLFKITHWQQYLIMLVVLLLYPLLMFIFWQLMPYNSFMRRDGYYMASLLLLILFSGISIIITGKSNAYYKPFYNIFNQVFYVTLVYSPLLAVAFLHDCTEIFHNHDYNNYYSDQAYQGHHEAPLKPKDISYLNFLDTAYYQYWFDEYQRWITILKYAGIVVFVLALPFFKGLFVKQIALPKKS